MNQAGNDPLGWEDGVREVSAILVSFAGRQPSRDEIRREFRPVCVRARNGKVDATEFIKLVKHCAAGISAPGIRELASDRQERLERVISVCIDEYYAAG